MISQLWSEHFSWSAEGNRILGLSTIGRATVIALNLNRPRWSRQEHYGLP